MDVVPVFVTLNVWVLTLSTKVSNLSNAVSMNRFGPSIRCVDYILGEIIESYGILLMIGLGESLVKEWMDCFINYWGWVVAPCLLEGLFLRLKTLLGF